ncbi:MAG: hypothetical protein HOC79_00385 [Euryarchaeota archaeon]|nr:hypothetical protein [Euryarchaeota archaeon]
MPTISTAELVRCPPRWLLVRIESSDGEIGWGEALGDLHEEVEAALQSACKKIIGRNISEIERLRQELLYGRFWRDGPVLNTVAAAIEMALWDIKGKAAGAPIHELLGGKIREKVQVYRNIWGGGAQEFAKSAVAALNEGMTAMKVSPVGPIRGIVCDADLSGMVEIVSQVRDAIGKEAKLAIDLHGRCSPSAGRRAISLVAPFDPWFVEEPMLPGDAKAMSELRNLRCSQPIPIAAGERFLNRQISLDHLFPTPAIDIIQPDISLMGLRDTFAVGLAAETAQVHLAPHCPYGPIQTAASLQIAAAWPSHIAQEVQSLGGAGLPGGRSGDGWKWAFELIKKPFEIEGGFVSVRSGAKYAGLGVEICEERIGEFAEQWNPHPPTLWHTEDGARAEW